MACAGKACGKGVLRLPCANLELLEGDAERPAQPHAVDLATDDRSRREIR
jgi:hypothetical protein